MSPRIALMILGLGSAAASKILSPNLGGMIRNLMENNLALSRLPPDEISMDGRDQLRSKSTSPVLGEYKHILNSRKRLKVSPKWRKDAIEKKTQEDNDRLNGLNGITKRSHMAMPLAMSLQNPYKDKEASKLFSFKTAIIKQAVHKALTGGLHIPGFFRKKFQQKWGKTYIY